MCNYELDNVVGVCTRPTVWTEAYTVYHVLNFPLLSSGHPERVMCVFSSITLASQLIPLVPLLATRFGQKTTIAFERGYPLMKFSTHDKQSRFWSAGLLLSVIAAQYLVFRLICCRRYGQRSSLHHSFLRIQIH